MVAAVVFCMDCWRRTVITRTHSRCCRDELRLRISCFHSQCL